MRRGKDQVASPASPRSVWWFCLLLLSGSAVVFLLICLGKQACNVDSGLCLSFVACLVVVAAVVVLLLFVPVVLVAAVAFAVAVSALVSCVVAAVYRTGRRDRCNKKVFSYEVGRV